MTRRVLKMLKTVLKMTVSAKNSVILASRQRIAEATALKMRLKLLRPTRFTKLLGTGCVSGRRRSTKVFQGRLRKFKAYAHRFHSLRMAGLNTRNMVQAIGSPSVLYGVETM